MLFLLLSLPVLGQSTLCVYFFTKSANSLINDKTLHTYELPSTKHIADVYSRVSGYSPILTEDSIDLPTRRLWDNVVSPTIIEVYGGYLNSRVTSLLTSSDYYDEFSRPTAKAVSRILAEHGINPNHIIIKDNQNGELDSFISKSKEPVFIIHYDNRVTDSRSLKSSNTSKSNVTTPYNSNSTGVDPLSEFQISQYQICLWTGLLMVLLVLSAICSIINMEVIPDSLLFAKFQSQRTVKAD